jgi:hypothetical protein
MKINSATNNSIGDVSDFLSSAAGYVADHAREADEQHSDYGLNRCIMWIKAIAATMQRIINK